MDPLKHESGSINQQGLELQLDANAYTNPLDCPFPSISVDSMNLDYMSDLESFFKDHAQNPDIATAERQSGLSSLPKLETNVSPVSMQTTNDSTLSPWTTYTGDSSATTCDTTPGTASSSAVPSPPKRGRKPKQPTLAPFLSKPSTPTADGSTAALTTRRRRRRVQQPTSPPSPGTYDKRTKFLERNRVAAAKCRLKKKAWSEQLEERARELHASKNSLRALTTSLREEVLYLKSEMVKHGRCEDDEVKRYMHDALGDIARERREKDVESRQLSVVSADDSLSSLAGDSAMSWDAGEAALDDWRDGEGELEDMWDSATEDQKLEKLLMHELVRDEHGGQPEVKHEGS